jgi:hypothetical protein
MMRAGHDRRIRVRAPPTDPQISESLQLRHPFCLCRNRVRRLARAGATVWSLAKSWPPRPPPALRPPWRRPPRRQRIRQRHERSGLPMAIHPIFSLAMEPPGHAGRSIPVQGMGAGDAESTAAAPIAPAPQRSRILL